MSAKKVKPYRKLTRWDEPRIVQAIDRLSSRAAFSKKWPSSKLFILLLRRIAHSYPDKNIPGSVKKAITRLEAVKKDNFENNPSKPRRDVRLEAMRRRKRA